jgi:MtaA/CmuA family methyltransferase
VKDVTAGVRGEEIWVEVMNSRSVLAALKREPVDRTPVCNPTSVATVELMDLVDAPFPDANRVPELMARLAATSYTELGFDSIMPVFSIIQESSALGCKLQWEQKDNWPTVKMREPIFQDVEDIKIPGDFLTHQDTRCVIEAIKILRKQFGTEVAIIGKTMGPWSLGYHCFGVEPFLLLSLDNPGKTKACLDKLKEATIQFGLAQIEAGADALTCRTATRDLVSGEYCTLPRACISLPKSCLCRSSCHSRQDRRSHGFGPDWDGGVSLRPKRSGTMRIAQRTRQGNNGKPFSKGPKSARK